MQLTSQAAVGRTSFQHVGYRFVLKLELMFMKHYAPDRCLYIKVAKLITGLGSVDVTPTKLQSQNIQKTLQVFYKNTKNTKK